MGSSSGSSRRMGTEIVDHRVENGIGVHSIQLLHIFARPAHFNSCNSSISLYNEAIKE